MQHVMDSRGGVSFDMAKLKEAVHYICATCTATDRLGAVKLNKILYYSDMLHYAETGQSITGATYVKRQRGPVPKQVVPAIESLCSDSRLEVRNVSVFDLVRRGSEAIGVTEIRQFSSDEIERINQMIRFVCDHSANEISDISHTIVWEAADLGEELPYETFLVSYLGEVDDAAINRAVSAVARAERETCTVYA